MRRRLRHHFPLWFPNAKVARKFLLQVRMEQPDARLVERRHDGAHYAACLSTEHPLGGWWRGLRVREGVTKGRRCVR